MMQLKYLPVRSGTIDPSTVNTTIHTMLDKEMIENKCTSWNKLDKTDKIKQLCHLDIKLYKQLN